MIITLKKIATIAATSVLFPSIFALLVLTVYAQESTLTPTPQPNNSKAVTDLQSQINDLQDKITSLKGQEKTLSSQISVMDNQMKLTQLRINATKQQIADLNEDIETTTNKIDKLEESLSEFTKLLLNRIVVTYEVGTVEPLHVLLSSSDASDFFSRSNYLKIVQQHDRRLIYDTQQAKNDYANQKEIFEDKKIKIETLRKQLESYTVQIDKERSTKQRLLAETQGSEVNYQRLLGQAEAQLRAFSNFTASRGGASILGNQTSCDDWGCYYNQRDSQWGNNALNNTQYTLASDGCLVTSMAMVYTHYGHRNVTPQTINSIPENFASYYPAWLKYAITADGKASSRVKDAIDANLSAGHPVVVGISYDGGPIADHFVVLISGSSGSYKMHDPFEPNARNVPFSDHYSVGSIREIYKAVF